MNINRSLAIAGLLTVLSACSMAPPTPSVDLTALEQRAERAVEAGDPRQAITLYRELAAATRGEQRAAYLTAAAGLAVGLPDFVLAGMLIDEARASATVAQRGSIEIVAARLDIGLGQPAAALQRLDGLDAGADPVLGSALAEVRGRALFALGRLAEAVRVLTEREIWLDTGEAVLANQQIIWDGLSDARGRSAAVPAATGDPLIDGWLALLPLTALVDDPEEFRRGLIDWRTDFASHPAAAGILSMVLAAQRGTSATPRRIALLLPLGSARRTQAQAVRDGFLAAHLDADGLPDSTIAIYDTTTLGSTEAYAQAQIEGADFIVGPLLPEEVEQVVPQAGFIPTLALNFSQQEGALPGSLYQFALAPEDEAIAIAERAIAAGQRTAVALFASNDRGYRLSSSFRDAFESLGGTVLNAVAYVPESQNFSAPITELLNIARSEQRHRRLQANLGRPIEFEPRRRQDVDMIFLQANPGLGRLLAPQLRFHNAGDIPTYATSDIYDPARQGADLDLNGVIFPDLPLLLRPDPTAADLATDLIEYWPQRARQWIRLYGFGYDAYRLIRRIYTPRPGDWPHRGITGQLHVDADGRVRRELPFAQFQSGRVTALADLPRVDGPAPPIENDQPAAIDAGGNVLGAR